MPRITDLDQYQMRDIEHAIWEYQRGEIIECLYHLEKAIPEIRDIHKKVLVATQT